MLREEISGGGLFESGGFVGFAFLLEAAELRGFLVTAAGEAGFLEFEIAKLLFVAEHDLDVEQIAAVVGELRDFVDQFEAASV